MLKFLVVVTLCFGSVLAQSEENFAEKVEIQLRGKIFYPGQTFSLDYELYRRGYETDDYNLRGIELRSDNRSNGLVELRVANKKQSGAFVRDKGRRNPFIDISLRNRDYEAGTPWELLFRSLGSSRDRVFVHRIIVWLDPR